MRQAERTLSSHKQVIISPDVDGFVSAELLARVQDIVVVGTYDKNILCLSAGAKIEDAIFLDCDMNRPGMVSVGNHMRLHKDNADPLSYNPNVAQGITTYSNKFPYATAFLVAATLDIQTSSFDHLRMAHADSTWQNAITYAANMQSWAEYFGGHPSVEYVLNTPNTFNQDRETFTKSLPLEGKTFQSFVSRRMSLPNYVHKMNEILPLWEFASQPMHTATKYVSGLVDRNTLIRYNKDIISYAEVFGGEYSVTYDEVKEKYEVSL